jgi:diguanylate cyclase (GGDEF)-like protein
MSGKILKYLILVLLFLTSSISHSAEVIWRDASLLNLDEHMEFTVSDSEALVGNEKWYPHTQQLPRATEQYLHFRVSVENPQNIDQSLWLMIPFPAIKHLTVTDGLNTWVTGDDMPFSTRPVKSPDYIFPVRLESKQTTQLSGFMQGEILRYTFSLSTPELANANYRHTLIRDMTFFGAMATLVIVCMIIFMATKYRSYLSFAVFTFSFGAWFFRVFGYGFEILWPNHPQFNDISYAFLLYIMMISSSWMVLSLLKRHDKQVKFKNMLWGYTGLLILIGIFSAIFLDLNTTLVIPLYWFFPSILLCLFIIYKEHKSGSIKAKWFALSMLPLVVGSAIVVVFALGFNVFGDPVIIMMLGIVTTCLLLTVLISTYLIKLLQSQRDTEQQQSILKTQQAHKLETLVKERTQELESSNQLLQELAAKDPLTKLPNRRSLDLFVDNSIGDSNKVIGIAMLDLDHFKRINDTYGHDVGDIVLYHVAEILRPLNTESCIAARFGGEEFAIVQRQPDKTEFESVLKELHLKVNQIIIPDYEKIQVKACIGWVISDVDETISECFRRADKALYQAKEQGRNQLVP